MAKEDTLLPEEMGKLEIHSGIGVKIDGLSLQSMTVPEKLKGSIMPNFISKQHECTCGRFKRNSKNILICKRRKTKVLKEPILKFLKASKLVDYRTTFSINYDKTLQGVNKNLNCECFSHKMPSEHLNVCALVDNCNQLKISSDISDNIKKSSVAYDDSMWWKKDAGCGVQKHERVVGNSPSCSQQALNPPCDVTIDELASYFETLVHIPKKMSSMAEMMYI